MTYRCISIPRRQVPESLKRTKATADSYPCAVCGVHVPRPKWFLHMIQGGGVALHPEDESAYERDGTDKGDMGSYPVGANCLKACPELRPYVSRMAS